MELGVAPAHGGAIRPIVSVRESFNLVNLPGWSADGRWLLWRQLDEVNLSSWINVSPVAGGETRTLTREPKGGVLLFLPQVAPDGRQVAWIRTETYGNSEIFVAGFRDGRLTSAPRQVTKSHDYKFWFAWTRDSRELLYIAGDEFDERGIYRVATSGGEPRRIEGIIGNPYKITVAAGVPRVVYQSVSLDYDLYRIDLNAPQPRAERFLSSTRYDGTPAFSPDGQRLAFASSRSGGRQIWAAKMDGSDLAQLTWLPEGIGTGLGWSPDGRSLVFTAGVEGNLSIFVAPAAGGPVKRLTFGPAEDQNPTWSPDGRSIYFESTRSGKRQIFRMRSDGSDVRQITQDGGFHGVASPDGKWLYYATQSNGLWKMPAEGGEGVQVLAPAELSDRFGFVVGAQGIYALGTPEKGGTPVVFHPFDGGRPRTLAYVNHASKFAPAVSPDGRWFVYSASEAPIYGTMLIENFR